jgi:hypothetical protein
MTTALLDLFDELCDLKPAVRELRLLAIAATDSALAENLRAMLKADGIATDLIAAAAARQVA